LYCGKITGIIYRMMGKKRRRNLRNPATRNSGRQSIGGAISPEDRDELDAEFDAVDIDDVVRQARNGRIDVAELDAR